MMSPPRTSWSLRVMSSYVSSALVAMASAGEGAMAEGAGRERESAMKTSARDLDLRVPRRGACSLDCADCSLRLSLHAHAPCHARLRWAESGCRMKFSQHNSSPFSSFFARRHAFKGHLARSGAFIRRSTVRFLSQESRNSYDNSTGSHIPLYSE